MAPVDVERVYTVFHLFAVSPKGSSTFTSHGAAHEPYIPAHFLAAAAREVGFYPTTSIVHHFLQSVPTASAGEITFAAFLQFCEDVAYTNRPGRSAVYKMVDDLDTRGGGLMSRRELFLILTNGSADITDGEIDAIMELLDPSMSGYVQLKDLAALLLDQCQHQRSLSRTSRSRSRPEMPTQPAASVDQVAEQQQQQQPADRRRHHHHRDHRAPQSPAPDGDRRERRKGHRQASGRTGTAVPQQPQQKARRRSKEREALDEPPPQKPSASSSAPATADGAAPVVVAERDRSFKRTDIGSNGEAAYRPYGSLYHRADAFERTQTAMTVDVDGPLSVSATAMRAKASEGAYTPSPESRRTATASKASPLSPPPRGPAPSSPAPLPPGPSTPSAGPAGAALAPSVDANRKAERAAKQGRRREHTKARNANVGEEGGASDHDNEDGDDDGDEPHLHTQEDTDGATNEYSRVEGTTVVRPTREGGSHNSPRDAPQPAAQDEATPALPSNPPRTKETNTKCCTMF